MLPSLKRLAVGVLTCIDHDDSGALGREKSAPLSVHCDDLRQRG